MSARHPSPASTGALLEIDIEAIWRDHADAALRYATVLVGSADAYDVTADAFLRVTRTVGWASVEHPRAYLLRAVTNRAHDHRRQHARRVRRELATMTADTVTTMPEPAVDLRRQIAALSVQQRAVIFLTYWEDMTVTAIADLLGLSTGTVHRTLDRARGQLRKAMR